MMPPPSAPLTSFIQLYKANKDKLQTPLLIPILTCLVKEGRKLKKQDITEPQKQLIERILSHSELLLGNHVPKDTEIIKDQFALEKKREMKKELTNKEQCDNVLNVQNVQDKKDELMQRLKEMLNEKRKPDR
jgi:hypothetical protein